MRTNAKYVLVSAVALAFLVAPIAMGAGEGLPVDGGARNPSPDQRQNYTKETEIIANVSTYGTRQSNKSTTGGGAIYGCRATSNSSRTCVRASNLADGQAFSFSGRGGVIGRIEATDANAKPFTTNATGVADGLNADRVDGRNAGQIRDEAVAAGQALRPFAQVAANGSAGSTRGVQDNGVSRQGPGDYDVVFTGDRSSCALTSTLVGTAPGEITVNPNLAADRQTTTVDVRTFDSAGTPADHAFHLSASC